MPFNNNYVEIQYRPDDITRAFGIMGLASCSFTEALRQARAGLGNSASGMVSDLAFRNALAQSAEALRLQAAREGVTLSYSEARDISLKEQQLDALERAGRKQYSLEGATGRGGVRLDFSEAPQAALDAALGHPSANVNRESIARHCAAMRVWLNARKRGASMTYGEALRIARGE